MSSVISIEPVSDARWDEFVRRQASAPVYHLRAWAQILSHAYRYRPRCLAVEEPTGSLSAVMPLYYGRGLFSGPRLSSMPVARVGGPLGPRCDEISLMARACELIASGEAKRLIVRSATPGLEAHVAGLTAVPDMPTWRMQLPADEDGLRALIRKRSKNMARSIAKAEKSELVVEEADTPAELRRFYRLYLATMRKHGALPRPFAQLAAEQRLLSDDGVFRLWVARLNGEIVAGAVFHAFADTMELLYASSDPAALRFAPNHALYWHAMRWAIASGYRCFDFGGAVEGTSLAEFKRRWGAEPMPIWHYEYARNGDPSPRAGSTAPAQDALPSRLQTVVTRTPTPVLRVVAPLVYRYL